MPTYIHAYMPTYTKHITIVPYHPPLRVVQMVKPSMKKNCKNSNSDLVTSFSNFFVLQKYAT